MEIFHCYLCRQLKGGGMEIFMPGKEKRKSIIGSGQQNEGVTQGGQESPKALPPSQQNGQGQAVSPAVDAQSGSETKTEGKKQKGFSYQPRNYEDEITLKAAVMGDIVESDDMAPALFDRHTIGNEMRKQIQLSHTIIGLDKAMEAVKAQEELMNHHLLAEPMHRMEELVSSGNDYTGTRAGRQYLLGLFQDVEYRISQYISKKTQENYGEVLHKYTLSEVVPHYQEIANLLNAMRYEHARTVDIIAKERSNNPNTDELPVCEKGLSKNELEKKREAWKFINESSNVQWHGESKENDQFRREILSYSAKMLETNVGTDLWEVIQKSGKELTLVPDYSPSAQSLFAVGSVVPQDALDGAKATPETAEEKSQYMDLDMEGANVLDVLKAAVNRDKKGVLNKNTGQYHNFLEGTNVRLRMTMGADCTSGGDVGEKQEMVQTIPWIIFAHELGHAAKSMNGTKINNQKLTNDEKKFEDATNSYEEMANLHIENALREEAGVSKRGVYKSFKKYGQKDLENYFKELYKTYLTIEMYQLEDSSNPKVEMFMSAFREKARESSDILAHFYQEKFIWEELRAKRNDDTAAKIGSYNSETMRNNMAGNAMMAAKNEWPEGGTGYNKAYLEHYVRAHQLPELNKLMEGDYLKNLIADKKNVMASGFQKIDLKKRGLNKWAYRKDRDLDQVKAVIESYNQQNPSEVTPAGIDYVIREIRRYIQKVQYDANGKEQHIGRIGILKEIQNELAALRNMVKRENRTFFG